MKWLLRLAIPVTMLATGCLSSTITGQHWSYSTGSQGGSGNAEQVIYLMTASDAAYDQVHTAINWAAYAWSISSDRIEIRVIGNSWCHWYPWEDCVQVYLGTTIASYGAMAVASTGITANQHILPGNVTYIQFDFAILNGYTNVWGNAACHEVGHALGLAHGDIPGPCQSGWPTQTDLDNIAALYTPHGEVL